MLETMRNAWRVPEIRKKLLYTLFMLLIFRLASMIPCPGVDLQAIKNANGMADTGLLSLMNMMNGSALSQMTIMAMGISPYINASIIMQLLCIAIPSLERLSKDGGEEGKKKINMITKIVTVALAVIQAIGIISALNNSYHFISDGYQTFFGWLLIGVVMAGGTALAMWIGDRITANGVGNGVSLLIFVGIIANLFTGFANAIRGVFTNFATGIWPLLVLIAITLFFIVVVTFVDQAERRIPVQYAKRVVGRKMYGGQSTYIPLKVLAVGVLPLIFAYSFMAFPSTIFSFFSTKEGSAYAWWNANVGNGTILYILICAALIVAFAYFYTAITFNPQDMAKNIQQQGGNIQGIRPGQATINYLTRTSNRLTLFAGLFLAILATIPSAIPQSLVSIPFGASSILIAVSVALETVRAVEGQLVMRNYKGFL